MNTLKSSLKNAQALKKHYPWITSPLIIGAPMRVMGGPHLALAVSRAGGLGFIGPGEKPESTATDLDTVRELLKEVPAPMAAAGSDLPVGVGYQLWNGDLKSAVETIGTYRPTAAWLFAPRNGAEELGEWTSRIREAHRDIRIWTQIGTVQEGLDIIGVPSAMPDVVVVQGAEAGGHGRDKDGLGIMTLFPEIADIFKGHNVALVAAGGIADARGIAAAIGLGASGVAMGTRFLATKEARIRKGYQDEIVRASDAAQSTTRTQLYNHLRGTFGWPEHWSPRTIINQSWIDHQAGVHFDELKIRHDEAMKTPETAWGLEGRTATYAGASIGLIHSIEEAGPMIQRLQSETKEVFQTLAREFASV